MQENNPTNNPKDTTTQTSQPSYKREIEPESIDTIFLGDINADQLKDTAYLHTAPIIKSVNINDKQDEHYEDCVNDSCYIQVHFTNGLPLLHHNQAIKGILLNVGDLDTDGTSELLYAPDWFSSCWQGIFIYSLKNNTWKMIGSTGVYRCADDVDYENRVKKINNHSFYLIGDQWGEDGGNIVKTKTKIKIN